ncbi:porin-like protein H precursor [Vibrio variabilis]|uniref:Porin-like protein H n=1 Tax=Vibrio variabilis TaxID=990271 RepID=A0ABQ0JA09_9VIBR|nr:porin-like protein H precursor [Vibrio variabilis]
MKKTLVALAVLAAAGSAQAIELYNQDNVTVNLTGDIEVVYLKGVEDGSEFQQEIQDADFGFDTRYAINDDLQFGGFWEFSGSSTDTKTGNVYVGLYSNTAGSIKFGRLDSMLDDAGIGSDFQFGINSFFSNGSPFGADESVRYDIDKGNFYGGIAYKQDKNGNAGLGVDGNFLDAKIGARVADFDFTGFYGRADFKGAGADISDLPLVTGEGKETFYAVEGRWSGVENLNLAIAYYNIKLDPASMDESLTQQTFALAADYTINKVIIAAGVSQSDYDKALAVSSTSTETWDKQTNWYINAGYILAPGATAYVEVGANDGRTYEVDGNTFTSTKNGTGVAVGIKAEF